MKEEEITTRKIITETIRQVQKLSELGEREFARVFYGIKDSNMDRDYVRSKFVYYLETGFISAYNRLDVRNSCRVLDYITEEVHSEPDYEETLADAEERYDRLCIEQDEGQPNDNDSGWEI